MNKKYKITINGKTVSLPKYYNNEVKPSEYRYTENNPYIGLGLSRETKVGKEYVGFEADVAEFNDEKNGFNHCTNYSEVVANSIREMYKFRKNKLHFSKGVVG